MLIETKIKGIGPHKYNNLTINGFLERLTLTNLNFLQNMHVHVAHYMEGNEVNTM